jgi:hypothetical protein
MNIFIWEGFQDFGKKVPEELVVGFIRRINMSKGSIGLISLIVVADGEEPGLTWTP